MIVLERRDISVMNSGIRIIKRGALGKPDIVPLHHAEKTVQERERETTSTVQGWVAEWKERKRSLQIATFALVRALDQSRQTSAQAVTVDWEKAWQA